MVDCSTGEIYYNKNLGYAFNIGVSKDVGLSKIHDIVSSAIKGSRVKRVPLQLRLTFTEPIDSPELPFQDINEFSTPYDINPF